MARFKYLTVTFLLRSDQSRYGELILDLKNDYTKQQNNYPKTLTDMYGLVVASEPTRVAPVIRGNNCGLNFSNVATNTEDGGYRDVARWGSGANRKNSVGTAGKIT